MNLQFNGINSRGRAEWVDRDLVSKEHPKGLPLEDWVVRRYRPAVEQVQRNIGRFLTKEELRIIAWVCGFEESTVNTILGLIEAASDNPAR